VLEIVSANGNYWSVPPTSTANVLWFNKKVPGQPDQPA
jgi:ABC-type glycerol-3-phosphate transport system substrate-binding protein